MITGRLIEKIISEIEFRCDATIDLTKTEQLSILSEILNEWGYGTVKDEWINNLISGPKKDSLTEKQRSNILKDFDKRILDLNEDLSDSQRKLMKRGMEEITILYDDSPKSIKKESAKWISENLRFSTNSNQRKAYLNVLGGNRKIISGTDGTNSSADLVSKMKQYVTIEQYDPSGIMRLLSSAAKSNFGKESEINSSDAKVKELFENHPILNRIDSRFHGVCGIKDENGNIKMPSNKYSSEYLKQSFGNLALQKTINVIKEQHNLGNLDDRMAISIESHRERLLSILKEESIPGKNAATRISESYNILMIELNETDSDMAASVMKQFAETRLYEEEIALGNEVYLPYHGTFPTGDMIKLKGMERVSLVSCKFGKRGRIYGCPSNAKSIISLHPDKSKRTNQGQYIGENGFTLLVNDNLIRGNNTEETIDKISEFISKTLADINLDTVFSLTDIFKISSITSEYLDFIDGIKKNVEGIKPVDRYWMKFNEQLSARESDFKTIMGRIITKEHVTQLIGENNVKNVINREGQVSPSVVLSMIEIANNIRTGEGYGLEHNKQFYEKGGIPTSITESGTTNPNDYSITFRHKRTAGRAGGGCQLSYTGDGTPLIENSKTIVIDANI